MQMKRLISKLRPLFDVFFCDLLLIIMIVLIMMTALEQFERLYVKVSLSLIVAGFVIAVLFTKYIFLYRKLGRDNVTGGKNKKEFERIAGDLISGSSSYVLVYANIDRFKLINDAYGDAEGDMVLQRVQSIIDAELRWDEVSGRIMADNFGVLMRFNSIKMLEHRLARISEQIAGLTDENGNRYGIVLYYGVYVIEQGETDIAAIMEYANLARRNISTSHMVPIGIYDERDRQRLNREKTLEMKMRKALEHGDFVPYLQPKYELKGETVAGAEALVRWIDPEEGMIYPNEFIPLFESNGFVVDVDLYMFEEVCKLQEKWYKEGKPIVPISVNLSRTHFSVPNFFERYEKILEKYDLPPRSIEIELTESLFYNDLRSLNEVVAHIHQAGLSCSIDDFGSGYSSLNMLKDVKVDALKLDRVFFASGDNDKRGKDIIQSVIQLAQALDLHTISEGVEERAQVDFLKEMDCDLIQGYVFAKPMPVPEFEELTFGQR